jgi:hypothetical protein
LFVVRMRDGLVLSATDYKKIAKHRAALIGEEAGDNFNSMVELRVVHDAEDAAAGSGFGVVGGVDEAGDAGVEDGSGAHGAGFEGDVESAATFFCKEAIVFERETGGAEGYDLGVGGGVAVAEDAVVAAGDDLSGGGDDDCAYWDFACGLGGLGFGYCGAEIGEIVEHR